MHDVQIAADVLVKVQLEDFDTESEISRMVRGRLGVGAVVSFVGLCRDEGGQLAALELEHYPGMARSELERTGRIALDRFDLFGIVIIHRFGKIAPGERIVLVAAASAHRQAAFDGASLVMDVLKTSAPFWKRLHNVDGSSSGWVEEKKSDAVAMQKWLDQ
ncbi:molybdenum cofactor biosynthesis protein MoaE [Agrobacterium pusense]|uniref:molybdenum cofactor biosynthesis protein MoaE n=1 Tax=Agrobacterium pusense TaxID=648995 RepID=UPI003FD54184